MVTLACAMVAYLRTLFLPRHKLALEVVALRQQLAVLKRKQPRPKLGRPDRLFWMVLRRLWEGWSEALIIVKPETVVSWHRAGFRRLWRWRSQRRRPGRPKVHEQIRKLNSAHEGGESHLGCASHSRRTAPARVRDFRAHGFALSSKPKRLSGGGQREALAGLSQQPPRGIAAFDFFTVPSLRFRTLYCFFLIAHGRRRILHFNVPEHPT